MPWRCQCATRFPKYSVGFANILSIFFVCYIFLKICRSFTVVGNRNVVQDGMLLTFLNTIGNIFYYVCEIVNHLAWMCRGFIKNKSLNIFWCVECVNISCCIWESLSFVFNTSIVPQICHLHFSCKSIFNSLNNFLLDTSITCTHMTLAKDVCPP